MEREIGFGVIGLGMGALRSELIARTEGARLVAVADTDDSRRKEVASRLGVESYREFRSLVSQADIDVVMIMTPSGMHAEMAAEAARAGKHVIVTKPMEVTLPRIDMMVEECRKAGVMLAVDFECRYREGNLRIRRALDEGWFGKLILGEARLKWYRSEEYYEGWHGTWRLDGGGSLMNQTVHQIDLLRWFMGPVRSVRGQMGVFSHDIETEDLAMAMLAFENGAMGTILGTTTYPYDRPPEVEIHGTNGAVVTRGDEIELWKFRDERQPPELTEAHPANVIEDMLSAIRYNTPVAVDGLEGRKSVELILAIYEAAKSGREVQFRGVADAPSRE